MKFEVLDLTSSRSCHGPSPLEIRPVPFSAEAVRGTALFSGLCPHLFLKCSIFVGKPMERAQNTREGFQAFLVRDFKDKFKRRLLHKQRDVVPGQSGKVVQPFAAEPSSFEIFFCQSSLSDMLQEIKLGVVDRGSGLNLCEVAEQCDLDEVVRPQILRSEIFYALAASPKALCF